MCICTLTSRSTHTARLCAVDLCTRSFALENCDCLYLTKPWHLTAKLLIRITREPCSPCSYQSAAPVVVNASAPLRSPSADSSPQETVVSSSPSSATHHSVGDLKVNNFSVHTGACSPHFHKTLLSVSVGFTGS